MNYRDLQNISIISTQILTEAANEVHDSMNRWPYTSPYLQEDRSGYGDDSKFNKPDDKIKKPGTEVPAPKKGGYGRISRSIPYGIGAHANRTASRVTTITGDDPGAPRSEKMAKDTGKSNKPKMVKKDGKWVKMGEDVDLYDLVLSHLLDEGYAESQGAAEAIMANMSEDWIDGICEEVLDEAEGSYGQTPKAKKPSSYDLLLQRAGLPTSLNQAAQYANETPKETKERMRQVDRRNKKTSLSADILNSGQMSRKRTQKEQAESYDLYDLVLAHLLDEGYAETQEQAEVIMVNMSEDWITSIVEG
jgi:hypothetical protein